MIFAELASVEALSDSLPFFRIY